MDKGKKYHQKENENRYGLYRGPQERTKYGKHCSDQEYKKTQIADPIKALCITFFKFLIVVIASKK